MKKIVIMLLGMGWIMSANAAYVATPLSAFDPLNLSIRMAIPNTTTTVAQAVMYVLAPTGYKLIVGEPASRDAISIALGAVPPDAFDGCVMTTANALLLLIGQHNRLLVDPVHKLISFDAMPSRKGG